MPKIKTTTEVAAHLTQLYIDTNNGQIEDPTVSYIQNMQAKLAADFETKSRSGRVPIDFQALKIRYGNLDEKLKETADYIKTGNVDPKELLKKEREIANLVAAIAQGHREAKEILDDPEHNAHEQYKELYNGYDLKPFTEIEPDKAQNVLKMTGQTKSAYKWIEEVYKDMDDPISVSEERVAMILAARQLGNAVYDHPENIKNTRISEAELRSHANKIMQTPEFKEYFKTVEDLDFKKTIKHGHGGYLEKTFEDFLVNNRPKEPLEIDINGRYQKVIDAKGKDLSQMYSYKNYKEYFEQNKGNVVTSKEVHAARMAAADALYRKDPEAPFDKKALDNKARQFMKDPSFKVMMAMPGKTDMLVNGDAPGFANSVLEMNNACKSMLNPQTGKFEHAGMSHVALNRLQERVEENPDLKAVVDSVNALKEGKKEPKDVVNTLNTIMDYQSKHINDKIGQNGKDLNDTLRLMHELTAGTPLSGVTQTQIDKVNAARNKPVGDKSHLTMEFLGAEGQAERDKLNNGPQHNDVNKGIDIGR